MKICITSQGKSLDSQVDPRFGRCQYFIVVDTETSEFEAVQNPNGDAMGGVGVQSGQWVARKSVQAVLTGHVGPNAFQTLQAAGIAVMTGADGTVQEAVEKYKRNEFKPIDGPSVNSKFGVPGAKSSS